MRQATLQETSNLTAIRGDAGFLCGYFRLKVEAFAYWEHLKPKRPAGPLTLHETSNSTQDERRSSSSLLLSSSELSDTPKSVSIKYEPASEPLHISVKHLFLILIRPPLTIAD